ncbi:MAG: ATPase domain-containing protein [Candidatus Methanomethylicaceae archaeon]
MSTPPDKKMSTGCPPIDLLLGGGLSKRELLLLYGERGSGKTSFAFQAILKAATQGIPSTVIYTEGRVPLERLMEMASSSWSSVCDQIWIREVKSFEDQDTLIESLEEQMPKQTGLLVIDSITSRYRGTVRERKKDNIPVNKSLNREIALIKQLCLETGLTVLMTSEVTAQLGGSGVGVKPVAAAILTYWSDRVIRMEKLTGDLRKVSLMKPEGSRDALIRITERGLVGADGV